MICIEVTTGSLTYQKFFDIDKQAQSFLTHLRKDHIQTFHLEKVESLQKDIMHYKKINMMPDILTIDHMASKITEALESLPVQPEKLSVDIIKSDLL